MYLVKFNRVKYFESLIKVMEAECLSIGVKDASDEPDVMKWQSEILKCEAEEVLSGYKENIYFAIPEDKVDIYSMRYADPSLLEYEVNEDDFGTFAISEKWYRKEKHITPSYPYEAERLHDDSNFYLIIHAENLEDAMGLCDGTPEVLSKYGLRTEDGDFLD